MTQRKGETLEEFKARESAYKKAAYEKKKAEKAAMEAEFKKIEEDVKNPVIEKNNTNQVKVTIIDFSKDAETVNFNTKASKAFLSTL